MFHTAENTDDMVIADRQRAGRSIGHGVVNIPGFIGVDVIAKAFKRELGAGHGMAGKVVLHGVDVVAAVLFHTVNPGDFLALAVLVQQEQFGVAVRRQRKLILAVFRRGEVHGDAPADIRAPINGRDLPRIGQDVHAVGRAGDERRRLHERLQRFGADALIHLNDKAAVNGGGRQPCQRNRRGASVAIARGGVRITHRHGGFGAVTGFRGFI